MNLDILQFSRPSDAMNCCANPCGASLLNLATQLIARSTPAPVTDGGWPAPGPLPMDHESSTVISWPIVALLNARCRGDLKGTLCPSDQPSLTDSIIQRLSASCPLSQAHPWRYSTLSDLQLPWPKREPDQARAILVGAEALELRIWLLDTPR